MTDWNLVIGIILVIEIAVGLLLAGLALARPAHGVAVPYVFGVDAAGDPLVSLSLGAVDSESPHSSASEKAIPEIGLHRASESDFEGRFSEAEYLGQLAREARERERSG
jgi:hypothetical protein